MAEASDAAVPAEEVASAAAESGTELKKTKSKKKSGSSKRKAKGISRRESAPAAAAEVSEEVQDVVDKYLSTERGAEETTALLEMDTPFKTQALIALVELIPYLNFNPSAVLSSLSRLLTTDIDAAGLKMVSTVLAHWVRNFFVRDFPSFSRRSPKWDTSTKSENIVVDMIEEAFAMLDQLEAAVSSRISCRVASSAEDMAAEGLLTDQLNTIKLGFMKGFRMWRKGGQAEEHNRMLMRRGSSSEMLVQPPNAVERRSSLGGGGGLFKSIFGRKKSNSPTVARKAVSPVRRASSAAALTAVETADELENRVDFFSRMPGSVESRALGRRVEPIEVACALTCVARGMFVRVRPIALIRKNWTRPEFATDPSVTGLIDMQAFFNQVSFWVAAAVCRVEDIALRGWMIEFFITIAVECRKQRNYSSMMAVMSGLNNISISRMKRAWVEVLPENLASWEDLGRLMNTKSNYGNYRSELDSIETGYVPFTGVLTRDITFIEEGNTYFVDEDGDVRKFNVEKMALVGSVLADLERAQRPMELPEEPEEMVSHLHMDVRRPIPEEQDDILYELSQKFEKKITSEEEWKKERKRRKKRASELTMKANLF